MDIEHCCGEKHFYGNITTPLSLLPWTACEGFTIQQCGAEDCVTLPAEVPRKKAGRTAQNIQRRPLFVRN